MPSVPEWWPSYESAEMNAAWWHGYNFACRSEGIIGAIEMGAIGEANRQAYLNGQRDMLSKCIALGDSHITRINNEAEFETVGRAEELFANADGIEFFVGELRALQEKP